MTIKALRKDIFLYQQTDSTIEMSRLVDINLSPIDLTRAIFYANFTNSITSQIFYPIVVTTDMDPTNGLYFLNFTRLLTDLPAACYIYNVDAVINSSKTPISFGNLIISRNV
jgi:ABC-type molybdate transport system substrate-binding protein